MTITEFANSRNEQPQTVSVYIRRHYEKFKGHTKKNGKQIELDEKALEILDKQYPMPKPIEIVEDKESREKLMHLQEAYIKLQAKVNEQAIQIAQAETMHVLLEDKQTQLDKAEKEIERLRAENDEIRDKYIKEVEKTWWDKLRRK